MMMTMKRVFSMPFINSSSGGGSGMAMQRAEQQVARDRAKGKLPLPEIKHNVEAALHDVVGTDAERLRFKVRAASSAHELWMLRSDIYQCISKTHSQSLAMQRINQLLPSFKQWLPAQQLTAI